MPDTKFGLRTVGAALIACCVTCEPADPGPGNCPADLTGDNVVNVFDLLFLLGSWGACPQ